jgi:CubicO group peptidase (beta-lactamase class C family)
MLLAVAAVGTSLLAESPATERPLNLYFPPPGEGLDVQSRVTPEEAGFDPAVIAALENFASRWALWRNGRLIHVKGDFNETSNVASHRKTWHALTVGAALRLGRIKSLDQAVNEWLGDLTGEHAKATWRHVMTQSAGFDYPYGDYPAFPPGRMWTYSDYNPVILCSALARVWGRKDYHDKYETVVKEAYFDAIGMRGWELAFTKDRQFKGPDDGVRFVFDLEDMGRLGLLVLARGNWAGKQLVPASFVSQLETKQTRGMLVNYSGPNDGNVGLDPKKFTEVPYGFMTWVNTNGDLMPGADHQWAYAAGAGGHLTMWNRRFGIVLAGAGAKAPAVAATILEKHLRGSQAGSSGAAPK